MSRADRRRAALSARIKQLEIDLGYRTRDPAWMRFRAEQKQHERNVARVVVANLLYFAGLLAWNLTAFATNPSQPRALWHAHRWLLYVTLGWDLPAALALAGLLLAGSWWLLTGRSVLK